MAAQLQQSLGLGSAIEAALIEQTRRELQALADALAVDRLVAFETALVQGCVVDEIARQADAMSADLVVLGAKGTGFLHRLRFSAASLRMCWPNRRVTCRYGPRCEAWISLQRLKRRACLNRRRTWDSIRYIDRPRLR